MPITWTDRSGAFELRGLPRGRLWLQAKTADATSQLMQVDLSEQLDADVELVLDVVGTIAGTVVDERGAPPPVTLVLPDDSDEP